ncbi:hypothetical protein FPCIR_7167 [Fusarium pseudocircinatum]|uniref:CFEM domain-containing protein n=1 Tax=Fusarium pseudocircinatum TaxID=56676 RepID=A0A8H5LBD8_9HYPO|nr:hypothetical protein FPCIR_7167 [Fusarium pseudocircinatum]
MDGTPTKVKMAYTPDSIWRNRDTFVQGRDQIEKFLTDKWSREHDYKLRKELFAFDDNKIAVQFWYEFRDDDDQWWRCYGLEDWTFDENGLMKKRQMSGNNVKISEEDRWFKDGVDVNTVEIGPEHWTAIMRSLTFIHLVLFTASVVIAAESTCAIDCFQGLITNGPPAGCKEATNYLCFCTMPTLQDNFVQCADKTCADDKDGTMTWANELCSKLGKPIDLGGSEGSPKTDETTAVAAPTTSASSAVKPTTEAGKTTDEVPTTTTEAKTESKVGETSSDKISTVTSESSAGETTATETSIKTTVSKPKETTEASGSAAEATADQTSDDSVVTITGTADTATATPSPTDGSNVANSAGPNFYAAVGVAAAFWQLL